MISIVNSSNTIHTKKFDRSIKRISEASDRLSSGKRVNSASDDPV